MAHRGIRVIALLFLDHDTRRDEGSASRLDRSLPPGKTRHPLYRTLGGPQGRSGHVRKISPPPGFDRRTVQPVTSGYTDWATRPTVLHISPNNYIILFPIILTSLIYEWPTGMEGRVLPLWRRTALRLNLYEPVKSHQSRGLWLILSVYIRPSISLHTTRPVSILKKWILRAFYDTQQSLLITCERSADTCIPSQVTILCIKPHFM